MLKDFFLFLLLCCLIHEKLCIMNKVYVWRHHVPIFSCDSRKKMRTNFTTFFGWHFNFLWVLLICIFIALNVCHINYELSACSHHKKRDTNDFKAREMKKMLQICNSDGEKAKKDEFIKNIKVFVAGEDFFVLYACPENMLLYTFWIKNCSNVPSISALLFTRCCSAHSVD